MSLCVCVHWSSVGIICGLIIEVLLLNIYRESTDFASSLLNSAASVCVCVCEQVKSAEDTHFTPF